MFKDLWKESPDLWRNNMEQWNEPTCTHLQPMNHLNLQVKDLIC